MATNRREFLRTGLASTLGMASTSGAWSRATATNGNAGGNSRSASRPILYNGDEDWYYSICGPQGCPPVLSRRGLEDIVNRLAMAKVTIFSDCFYAAGRCWYSTQVGQRFDTDRSYVYCPELGPFTNQPDVPQAVPRWRMAETFRRLLSEGNEPLKVFIEASHRQGLKFLSCLRMNDRHSFNVHHPPPILREHPEFAMKWKDGSVIGGMDFQYPEVRDYVFAPMQEMATNYDVDGLELDWMRWCQMFSEDVPREMRIETMNKYHRRIRRMLDEVGKRKGKQFLLSVRVPQTLEECEELGFDVATYAREELIDILCPSDFIILDPHMRLEPFIEITRDSGILLLPSLHPSTGFLSGFATTENIRAVAHSYYAQGADGISAYNWFVPRQYYMEENLTALAECAYPDRMAKLSREYLFNPMWGRKSETGRLIDYQVRISRSSSGKRGVFPLLIKEDLNQVGVTLKWKVENLTPVDEVQFDVNGKPIERSQCKVSYFPWGKSESARLLDTGWAADPYYLFELMDAGPFLKSGSNEIGFTLVRSNPLIDVPVDLFEVHVDVKPI